ncbi:hypothetical protein ACFQBQ_07680 [Granulicella cerasi]|uniref:Uncharacterized protein n=1 Tax=Granulicella cerasi TaxID=741063 RepID=A0ABW1Z7U7_9BACT|nr:hypothetical protein [Granulicella cerasi]
MLPYNETSHKPPSKRQSSWVFFGIQLAIVGAVLTFIFVRYFHHSEGASWSREIAANEKQQANVSEGFKKAANSYLDIVDAEQRAAGRDVIAYRQLKGDAERAKAVLRESSHTEAETYLANEIVSDPYMWEFCVEVGVYTAYPTRRIADCRPRDVAALRNRVR